MLASRLCYLVLLSPLQLLLSDTICSLCSTFSSLFLALYSLVQDSSHKNVSSYPPLLLPLSSSSPSHPSFPLLFPHPLLPSFLILSSPLSSPSPPYFLLFLSPSPLFTPLHIFFPPLLSLLPFLISSSLAVITMVFLIVLMLTSLVFVVVQALFQISIATLDLDNCELQYHYILMPNINILIPL